jgi:hypothetical protein
LHVEEHQVRLQRGDGLDRCAAARCLAGDFDVRLGVEQPPQAVPRDRLVVDDQDAHRSARTRPAPASFRCGATMVRTADEE